MLSIVMDGSQSLDHQNADPVPQFGSGDQPPRSGVSRKREGVATAAPDFWIGLKPHGMPPHRT